MSGLAGKRWLLSNNTAEEDGSVSAAPGLGAPGCRVPGPPSGLLCSLALEKTITQHIPEVEGWPPIPLRIQGDRSQITLWPQRCWGRLKSGQNTSQVVRECCSNPQQEAGPGVCLLMGA